VSQYLPLSAFVYAGIVVAHELIQLTYWLLATQRALW